MTSSPDLDQSGQGGEDISPEEWAEQQHEQASRRNKIIGLILAAIILVSLIVGALLQLFHGLNFT